MKYLILIMTIWTLACSSANKKSTAQANSNGEKKEVSQSHESMKQAPAKDGESGAKHKIAKKKSKGPENEAAAEKLTCTSGSDSRTIVITKSNDGCEVNYTKAGKTNSVASGSGDMKHCNEVSNKIKANLTSSGFSCN